MRCLELARLVEHRSARSFVWRRTRIVDDGLQREVGVAGDRRLDDEVHEAGLGVDPPGERFAQRRHLVGVDAVTVDGCPDLDDRAVGDVGQYAGAAQFSRKRGWRDAEIQTGYARIEPHCCNYDNEWS